MIEHLGVGDVEIELDGKKYVMRPTIDAVMTISRLCGGLTGAIEKVAKVDVDTIVTVIQLGLGQNVARGIKDLPEMVWRAGFTDRSEKLHLKVMDYLTNLMNGGRPRDASEADERPRLAN